jgi:hypothetical protein
MRDAGRWAETLENVGVVMKASILRRFLERTTRKQHSVSFTRLDWPRRLSLMQLQGGREEFTVASCCRSRTLVRTVMHTRNGRWK